RRFPRHHARITRSEIGVDLAPEADYTRNAIYIQASEGLMMVCAVDQDIRLALRWAQWRKVVGANPGVRLRRDTSAGQVSAKRTLVRQFSTPHARRRLRKIHAQIGIPDQARRRASVLLLRWLT